MRRSLIALSFASILFAVWQSPATAACSVTYTFSNGTTADATQVNQNFNDLTGCVAPAANPVFSGNVGIGMSASNILDITQNQNGDSRVNILNNDSGANADAMFRAFNGSVAGYFGVNGTGATPAGVLLADGVFARSSGTLSIVRGASYPTLFGTVSGEDGRIGTDGSLLWGTTTNGGWSAQAKIEAVTSNGAGVSGYATAAGGVALQARVDSTSGYFGYFTYNGATVVGSITTNGTATSYNTTSDTQLKLINSRQADFGDAIRNLWVGSFRKWDNFTHRGTSTLGFGVLAQQAYSVLPQAIRDGGAVTKPIRASGTWMASSEPFAYLALWGVKDVYQQQDAQKKRIETLEAQLKSQRQTISNLQRSFSELQSEILRQRKLAAN